MRTVLSGGRLFDGTGAAMTDADVAVEDGRIAQVGANLRGDETIDVSGMSPWGVDYPGMPGGVCDGVDGVRAKVREMIRAGADVIKIASSGGFISPVDDPKSPHFSQQELDAIVETAADLGRPVMSHAHGAEGIKRAVRAGVRSIEHGTFLDDEGIELMLERGTWLVPTLTAGDTTEEMAANPKIPERRREKLRAR